MFAPFCLVTTLLTNDGRLGGDPPSLPTGHTYLPEFRMNLQTFIEQALRLLQHLRGQYRWPSPIRLLIEPRDPFLPIAFHGPLDADERHPKGAG
jgi:hypothetical protein